ncbi:unnamed protein product [Durusdinium trenchii]|uniref:Uncharacterized protein n=2 Tax=Durusdinium trenchii TaxID=1381693 RepID=A0ABP0LI87_9DINO
MVDLLPAGVISHGLYGGSKWVQNQPTGHANCWGVLRPGAPLNFSYVSAMVGAGYIACEGHRVCGATMTNDGFGRWSVPSARDLADVFNMIMASSQSQLQYFDMTVERIFERMNLLQSELRRSGAPCTAAAQAATPAACAVSGAGAQQLPVVPGAVVQGQVIEEGQWQPVSATAPLRPSSARPGMAGAGMGSWEPLNVMPHAAAPAPHAAHVPTPPQTARVGAPRPGSRPPDARMASAMPARPAGGGTPGARDVADLAAELERCAQRSSWAQPSAVPAGRVPRR